MSTRRRVQFSAPGEVEVVTDPMPVPDTDEVRVRTQYSAVSPGTERLVYQGDVPRHLEADSSIEALQGDFSYPLSYGYACVGEVERVGADADQAWIGTSVFAFQPHVSHFVASPDTLIPLPEGTDLEGATLIPSVETAVNLVMDGRPMIGESVVVFGQGVVGLLTTQLLANHPLTRLKVVEPVLSRRERAESRGAQAFESAQALETCAPSADPGRTVPDDPPDRADLVYELTGRPHVLNDAVAQTGFGGRLVIGSWYGTKQAPLKLGGHFHRSRMRIISSQVSTIDPDYRGRWTKGRRMSVVLNLLGTLSPRQLISDRFRLEEAATLYTQLADDASTLQPVIVYD